MKLITREQSLKVAEEIFLGFDGVDGMNYISIPETGVWKTENLSFSPAKITKVILKRPETSRFPVFGRFSKDGIAGEAICQLPDGTPAISIDGDTLRFGFDPYAMHLTNLNEGFRSSGMERIMRSALITYSYMPPSLRRRLRWVARRYKTSHIRSIGDLDLLGVSSNVIVHLFEQHLREIGLIKKQQPPPSAVITHDIDTDFCQKEGREMVSSVADDERVQATWFFVPRSVHYTLDRKGVRSLIENGHEIGMHGYSHDGSLALNNAGKLSAQLRKGKRVLESIGTKVKSFRSPWTIRSILLLLTLRSEGFTADSSYPDVDTLGMTGGRKGLSYNRPFRPLLVRDYASVEPLPLWEVPITGPQDVQVIQDLRLSGSDMLKVWNYKAEFCRDFGGVYVLHTHPQDLIKNLDCYADFLRLLKRKGFRLQTMNSLTSGLQSQRGE